jgi:hypothetical protein
MLEIERNQILHLASDILLHSIEDLDKYWAFNIRSGDHYSLNESAFFLLAEFRQPHSISDALDRFRAEFDITAAVAIADGLEMINDFINNELLIKEAL